MQNFSNTVKIVNTFEGYLNNFQIALIDSLLIFQFKKSILDNILELGCYKGKTASLLAIHCPTNAKLILVDKYNHFTNDELNKLNSLHTEIELIVGATNSKEVRKKIKKKGKFSFVHGDTSHTFKDTLLELSIAKKNIQEYGLIAIDDFTNLNYPGVVAAVYDFLSKNRDLALVMVTEDKAYICLKKYRELYEKFIETELLDEMSKRGLNTYLSRTDNYGLSDTIRIGEKLSLDDPDHYGFPEFEKLYKY